MRVVIEGSEKEIKKVIRENRLRAARGILKVYPCSKTCAGDDYPLEIVDENRLLKATNQMLTDENELLKAKVNELSHPKVVIEETDSKAIEDTDSKTVGVDDNKEVKETDEKAPKVRKE